MRFLFSVLLLFASLVCLSQEEIEDVEAIKYEETDSIVDVAELYKEKIKYAEKKKKFKRNEFYGIKTKKAYTKTGGGNRVFVELFFVIKGEAKPSIYSPEIYWFDTRTRRIRNTRITEKDKPFALIVHGPYKKLLGKQVIEEGIFYVGSKHGRWLVHDRNNILLDKQKYYKGFEKGSKITHYDEKLTKVKEVIPEKGLVKDGKYIKFFPSGNPEMEGYYVNDIKVGLWTEFYDKSGYRKKETRYPDEPEADAIPKVEREWDANGRTTFDINPKKKTNSKR